MKAAVERVTPGAGASFLCRRRIDARFAFNWHFHAEIELTAILHSRGRRFVGDSIEAYGDGDLVLLGPNLPHTWHSDAGRRGRHEAVFCQVPEDFLDLGMPEFSGVKRLLRRAARGLRFTGATQKAVLRKMEGLTALPGLARLAALLDILDRLARSREGRPLSSREFVPELRRGDEERVDRVCRHLTERCREGVTLAEAARVAHLSIPAFSRAFRRTTGKTLVGYLHELRTGLACRALIESERAVSDIAFASGFNNLSNFNRRFRALKGMSPREYRRAFRQDH